MALLRLALDGPAFSPATRHPFPASIEGLRSAAGQPATAELWRGPITGVAQGTSIVFAAGKESATRDWHAYYRAVDPDCGFAVSGDRHAGRSGPAGGYDTVAGGRRPARRYPRARPRNEQAVLLTVDDDPEVLERRRARPSAALPRRLPHHEGVVGAGGARHHARAQAARLPVALFLVDERMPGMTGTAVPGRGDQALPRRAEGPAHGLRRHRDRDHRDQQDRPRPLPPEAVGSAEREALSGARRPARRLVGAHVRPPFEGIRVAGTLLVPGRATR